jgi:hypothetical protein
MLSKARISARGTELRDLINDRDPIGLIRGGAPLDEYECLVGPLMGLLERHASPEEIAAYLAKEFSEHFGSPIAESSALDFAIILCQWYSARWATST